MNLANMTREKLWALNDDEIEQLSIANKIPVRIIKRKGQVCNVPTDWLRRALERNMYALQQSAAEERQESIQDR